MGVESPSNLACSSAWDRALVSYGEEAEDDYRDAIAKLEQTPVATDIAWTHLLFRESLLRQNRRIDVRESLHVAKDMFGSMGPKTFAVRTAIDLRATGEHAG